MKTARIDIASIRREQVVEAAVAVIAEQGLQNLSLSEIEKKVGMSRGQLMYYFKSKEEILLAVFDRLVQMMHARHKPEECEEVFAGLSWLEVLQRLLEMILRQPPAHPEFSALQYTFLSQIAHREDFRSRLATLYAEWRGRMAQHVERDLGERPGKKVDSHALATLVQAMLHGLAIQLAADPSAVDTQEVIRLALDMFETYLWGARPTRRSKGDVAMPAKNGHGKEKRTKHA